jgi:hypothetical protein
MHLLVFHSPYENAWLKMQSIPLCFYAVNFRADGGFVIELYVSSRRQTTCLKILFISEFKVYDGKVLHLDRKIKLVY